MLQRNSIIKAQLRRRIILHSDESDLVLYEGKLAEEFGVSRTPIRQVIQSLAAESLVDVRSGVGTIAPPMLPERRVQDLTAYSAILLACSTCTTMSGLNNVKIELATLRMHLDAAGEHAPSDVVFDVSTRLITALGELVDDKILKGTLVSCFWRFIRRRFVEHQGDVSRVIQELAQTIKAAEHAAESGDPAQVFRIVSATVDAMITAPSST